MGWMASADIVRKETDLLPSRTIVHAGGMDRCEVVGWKADNVSKPEDRQPFAVKSSRSQLDHLHRRCSHVKSYRFGKVLDKQSLKYLYTTGRYFYFPSFRYGT
jgi:hypothetical protein